MPGIFGFIKKNQKSSLHSMQQAMTLYPPFKQDNLFEDDLIAASRVHLGKIGEQSSPTKQGSLLAWIEGEAYNLAELAPSFGYSSDTSFATALLTVYENNKLDSFLNKLDGYFCACIYDQKKSEVKLISDRYGMRMLYWYMNEGKFAWASEVKGILALDGIDKTIDPISFDCFMELGYLLGEHTWFDKIKLIKPATVLSFNLRSGNITQYHYWSWAEITPSSLTFDEAVDELGKRFIKAVERRFNPNEKIGITLSGGLDSRIIFAAVDHLYPNYKGNAFTFGVNGCDDIILAKQVTDRSNWKHTEYYFTSDNWLKPRVEKVWNTDGMKDMKHMHGGEFLDNIVSHIGVNLNGYGGGLMTGELLSDKNFKLHTLVANKFTNRWSGLITCNDKFYSENYEAIVYMNRNRRFTNMGTVNSLIALENRKPIMDNAVVELLTSLPREFRKDNKLYAATLLKFFPKYFKDIPWQRTGKPVGLTPKRSFIERAFNRGIRELNKILGIKSSKDYTDYNNWIRSPEVSNYLMKLLNVEDAEYSKVTDINLLEKYLLPHLQSKHKDYSDKVLRAATVEIYLKKVAVK